MMPRLDARAGPGLGLVLAVIGTAVAILLVAALALLFLLAGVARQLERRARERSVDHVADLPADSRPALLVVLGCPPRTRSGRANPHLTARADTAARAYHALREVEVLCSGRVDEDGGADGTTRDEAMALALLLQSAGVPPSAIRFDRRARRTIDTIDFVAAHHRNARILIVTQSFHLPRVLFLARARSLDAWGLAAPGPRPRSRGRLREAFGQLRALFDVGLARRGR